MTSDKSPYEICFSDPVEGLIRQELISYRVIDGKMYKVTVEREFQGDDYIDSQTIVPLG